MKAYQVTYPASPRFRGRSFEELKAKGFNVQLVGMFDATSKNPAIEALTRTKRHATRGTLTAGEVCCCLGHMAAWKAFLDSDEETCLVVEDDALPLVDRDTLVAKMARLPGGFHGCLLFKQEFHKEDVGSEDFWRSRNCGWGTVAYFLSRAGAVELMNQKTITQADGKTTALSFKANFYVEKQDSFAHDWAIGSTLGH